MSGRQPTPLFIREGRGRPSSKLNCGDQDGSELPAVADCRKLNLEPRRICYTRVAGIFLFLLLLARLRFDQLVIDTGYPSSEMISASSALLALLSLKLLDKERKSHIDDFNFDEVLGWACKKYCVTVGNRVFPPILLSLRRFSHGCDFDRQGPAARD
jgi:hypothetical protein